MEMEKRNKKIEIKLVRLGGRWEKDGRVEKKKSRERKDAKERETSFIWRWTGVSREEQKRRE